MTGVHLLPPPAFCIRQAMRYAGCREETAEIKNLMESAWQEAEEQLSYRVCCMEYPCSIENDICDLSFAKVRSASLAGHLKGCEKVLVMGATVGANMDRLIGKYSRLSPARGVMLQAIGAERIEALCDDFCRMAAEKLEKRGLYLTARFSPGYGDLLLQLQKDIFRALDLERKIGLTLNDSLLMYPSKSVTAIIGITKDKQNPPAASCRGCKKQDCAYRRNI